MDAGTWRALEAWLSSFPSVATLAIAFVLVMLWLRRPLILGRLEPVRLGPGQTPADLEAYAGQFQADLADKGFRPIGDYQTVHGPSPSFTRFFYHGDGEIFAEAQVYRGLRGLIFKRDLRMLTFFSVLADGTGIFTGNQSLPDGGASAAPGMVMRGLTSHSVTELLEYHRQNVEVCVEQQRSQPLSYAPEQVPEISHYYTQYQRDHFALRGAVTAAS